MMSTYSRIWFGIVVVLLKAIDWMFSNDKHTKNNSFVPSAIIFVYESHFEKQDQLTIKNLECSSCLHATERFAISGS